MAPDEPSGTRPAPVVLRIKLRYDDVEAMVQRFAPNVGKSGLFLPTKSLQAVGAEVKFELRLADDKPVLVGFGRVKAAKAPDPAHPKAAFGMAIELTRVTREGRELILKLLERRKVLGLAEVGIPLPADIDAARMMAVPNHVSAVDSAPIVATHVSTESGPVLTAPRLTSGPFAVAKVHVVAPLEPEPPRKKRAAVHEVIERASGPVTIGASASLSVPGLDDDVDLGTVLARARALAGADLDAELDALRESTAAPIEISIEAASAELARQLGGAAVKRDRSAGWAPPPAMIATPIEAPAEAVTVIPDETPDEAPVEQSNDAPVETPAVAAVDAIDPSAFAGRESTPIIDLEPDADQGEPDADDDGESDGREPAQQVEADQIADEIHQLSENDFEEVEHTAIGKMAIDPSAFDHHAFVTEPGGNAELERSLDEQLAAAEAEADADDLGLSAPALATTALADEDDEGPSDDEVEEEVDDFEILEAESAGTAVVHEHEPEPEPEPDAADEFEHEYVRVPARVRARQKAFSQLLAVADPEKEPATEPPQRPSDHDFASRLELSDEFEAVPEGDLDPKSASAVTALAAFDDDDDDASGEFDGDNAFTIAGELSHEGLDLGVLRAPDPGRFPGQHGFDSSDVSEPFKRVSRPALRTAAPPVAENFDLETALEALDVDLDDLAIPNAPTDLPTRPLPADLPADIPIDFDDFDEE